jgi:hypothetical protein
MVRRFCYATSGQAIRAPLFSTRSTKSSHRAPRPSKSMSESNAQDLNDGFSHNLMDLWDRRGGRCKSRTDSCPTESCGFIGPYRWQWSSWLHAGMESPNEPKVSEPETVEYRLAVVDSGGYVAPDDPIVSEFAIYLDALEQRCPDNTREQIADQTISIQQQLAERGVSEGLLEILQSVADPTTFRLLEDIVEDFPPGSIPEASRRGDCAAYLTAYHELRIGRA